MRGRSIRHHIRQLNGILDLILKMGRKFVRLFSTLRKLVIEVVGHTFFAFKKNGRREKSHRVYLSSVQRQKGAVDDQ